MRRIDLRVRADDVPSAYDRLLPHLRDGLHAVPDGGDHVVLVALGEREELPSVGRLAALAGDLLIGAAVERHAGDDLGAVLAELLPSWEIAGRVVLRTPAHPAPPPELIDVVLAREPAFGSGAHPTTRNCIELLLEIEPGGGFADLGCGSGALSIVAFKLGYAPIAGIDLEEVARHTAARNADANGIDAAFVTGDLLLLERVDARVAAMNVSSLDVHAHLATVTMPATEWLIVSGLDDPEQLARAIATYAEAGFAERRRVALDGWPAVLLEAAPRG